MRRVLVTGATTPLGSALIQQLLQAGAEKVLAVGRETEPGAHIPVDPRVRYAHFDLARPRSVRRLMCGPVRDLSIDTIVHMALHRHAGHGGTKIWKLNVELTRLLLRLAEESPCVNRFVMRSHAEIYRVRAEAPSVMAEDQPLDLSPDAPQWVRDRVEADLAVCTRMGMSKLSVCLLRASECLAPDVGSQLWDYLSSRLCLRPLGFDPMLNVVSIQDLSLGLCAAVMSTESGIFNIPGKDTLPLSELIAQHSRVQLPVPGLLLGPLYRWRALLRGQSFRYDLNHNRLHFSGILNGQRAARILGYQPRHSAFSERW